MRRRHVVGRSVTILLAGIVVCFTVAFAVVAAAEPDKPAKEPAAKSGDGKAAAPADAKPDGKDEKKRPVPAPDLSPGDVVKIVLDALKNNDAKDTGIATTFAFASPGNRKVTGPLERFIPMLKNPAYAPMLNHKSAKYGKVVIRDDAAQQVVKVVDAKGHEAMYVFRLSKQADGDLKDCWLTDGVVRVEPADDPVPPKIDDPAEADKPDRA
jgi:hypothetical protein